MKIKQQNGIPKLVSVTFSLIKQICFIIFFILGTFSLSLSVNSAEFSSKASTTQPPLNETSKRIPLRIAVATNFAPALAKLKTNFEQKYPIDIQLISGSTGTLFQQIMYGAPFDIFLAADSLRPTRLVQHHKAAKSSQKTYTIGAISFWSSSWKLPHSKPSFEQLIASLKNSKQRLAIANPNTAPYGKAAKEMLYTNLLWTGISPRLITSMNIGQTFQQVRSKAIDLGIVGQSQLVQNNLHGVAIPKSNYQPIKQQLVILNTSTKKQQAQQFVEFLLSKATQKKLNQLGYQKLDEEGE